MTAPQFQAPPEPTPDAQVDAVDTEGQEPSDLTPEELLAELKRARKDAAKYRVQARELSSRPTLDDDTKRKLAEYDKFVEAQKTETQRAQEELARWQTDAEKWRGAAVASTVKALAAADFADPDDAVRNVDPAQYLDAGGTINEDAIRADLAKILEAKPHYRRATEQQGPRPPRPNPHQGSGQGGRASADPAQEFATILQGALKQ